MLVKLMTFDHQCDECNETHRDFLVVDADVSPQDIEEVGRDTPGLHAVFFNIEMAVAFVHFTNTQISGIAGKGTLQ